MWKFLGSALIIFTLLGCDSSQQKPAPTAPDISWNGSNDLYIAIDNFSVLTVVGERIAVKPRVMNGNAVNFTVSPELPIGLTVDSGSGTISGITAVVQPKTRYSVNVFDDKGRSTATSVYIETRADIFIKNSTSPEVTSVSGKPVDLNQFVGGGKGGYRYEIVDPSFGSVTVDGIYTPGTKMGEVEFRVLDDRGVGSQVRLKIRVGVPRLAINFSNPLEGSPLLMQLTLSGRSSSSSTLNYSVELATAMADNVSQTPGSVTFGPGEIQKTINIPTFNNRVNKDNGVINVILNIDNNIKFDDSELRTKSVAVVIINLNPPPLITFATPSSTFVEADSNASVAIKLDRASSKVVSVEYSLDKLFSTVQSFDHNFIDGAVTFQPGEILKSVPFRINHDVNGNQPGDKDRIMSFKLANAINASLGAATRYNMTVIDPLVVDIGSEIFDFVLLEQLQSRGWNGIQNVLVRIGLSGILRSTSTARGAFASGFIRVELPTKITLINKGIIVGRGGDPGQPEDPTKAAYTDYCNRQLSGNPGGMGGPAISVVVPISVYNEGSILGGAGGGGGGVSAIVGTDVNCSTKSKLSGGTGGLGADSGSTNYTVAQPGLLPLAQPAQRVYLAAGGDGGLPGEAGKPGLLPAQILNASVSPAPGGAPGYSVAGLDEFGAPYATVYRTCRYVGQGIDRTDQNVPMNCQARYGQLVANNVLPSGLSVSEPGTGVIKGSNQ